MISVPVDASLYRYFITSCAGDRYNMPSPPASWLFDFESGVRVTCDVGYFCANVSLPRPLSSRLRPDVRDRQTDVRRASSLNAPYPRGGGIIIHKFIISLAHCNDIKCCNCTSARHLQLTRQSLKGQPIGLFQNLCIIPSSAGLQFWVLLYWCWVKAKLHYRDLMYNKSTANPCSKSLGLKR